MKHSNKIRTLSLFSGAGGLDLGFHSDFFNILGCLEIDTPSCETLELNRGKYVDETTKIYNWDITKYEPSDLELTDIDFIIGGPPCQSFSAAGRRAGGVHGINDTRGSLFWYYCKYLEHFRPRGFLFENVKGILQANSKDDWDTIVASFESVGYRLNFRVLDAADYGTPQHRERLILVGVRNDLVETFQFPAPTHGPLGYVANQYVTPAEAFNDIDDPRETVPPYGGKYGDLLDDIPPGQNYSFYTERLGHARPQFAWRSKFSGFLYKLAPDQPSKTVVAHQGRYDGPFHWKNRKLNVTELKRIQGFPDDYRFVDSKVETVRQIGNSVAPKMATQLAKAVAFQIFGVAEASVELFSDGSDLQHSKRKAVKASLTKRTTTKSIKPSFDQMNLFAVEPDFSLNLCDNSQLSAFGQTFQISEKLEGGRWRIDVASDTNNPACEITLKLEFSNPKGCEFNYIEARIRSKSVLDLSVLWDCVHAAVASSSSYENLQPLYGHFTEPYPTFNLGFDIKIDQNQPEDELFYAKILRKMADFQFLADQHPYVVLECCPDMASQYIRALRSRNFDIRTHETNRAIKPDMFRPCYPFSLHSKSKNYVVWREKGDHKTGDMLERIDWK